MKWLFHMKQWSYLVHITHLGTTCQESDQCSMAMERLSEAVRLFLPYSLEPCDRLTSGQEDLGCCLFSSLTIKKKKKDKLSKIWVPLRMNLRLISGIISILPLIL